MDQQVEPKTRQQGNTENAWYKWEVDYKEARSSGALLGRMLLFFPLIICVIVITPLLLLGGLRPVRWLWIKVMGDGSTS
jgi:hypothetical protein